MFLSICLRWEVISNWLGLYQFHNNKWYDLNINLVKIIKFMRVGIAIKMCWFIWRWSDFLVIQVIVFIFEVSV